MTFKVLATWAAANDSALKFLSTAVDNFGQGPNFQGIYFCGLNYPPVEISGFPQTDRRDFEIFNMRSIQTRRLRSPVWMDPRGRADSADFKPYRLSNAPRMLFSEETFSPTG
ncbi:hypothetical protein [Pseudomonas yamanorum]|uniref:Uncharacterized protein n=1 Tax=Pseudomonas yamanorum TaxID=515393 RepID=A0A7Y8EC74_9PSED|nr:hypothetical protein [Pseudomonas yamanorum]NWE11968.1 hypothetical protein [Pseudomonas yamanorum]